MRFMTFSGTDGVALVSLTYTKTSLQRTTLMLRSHCLIYELSYISEDGYDRVPFVRNALTRSQSEAVG